MQLNPNQKQAVSLCDRPLLVLAGAGSGKTGVITQKISWLVEHEKVDPKHIVAVTFTNKAAAEMKHRLIKVLGKNKGKHISISTFHRFGLRLLQKDGPAVGLNRGFTILDQSDTMSAIQEIIRESNLPHDEKLVRNAIGTWKNQVVTPTAAMSTAENEYELGSAQVYARYDSLLKACNSVDFDDLISLPVILLREHPEIKARWNEQLQHLLVDEYQDTNVCQYELVKLLLGDKGILTAVGDDDQSIYSWRGANPENLANLKKDFPTLEVIKLEQNYRSSQRILRSANAVIAENPHLFEKRLWSDLGVGDPLRLSACHNAIDEAEWVAADILTQQFQFGTPAGDIAILYRSNFQSRPVEKALRERHINYHISGGQSFFDNAEIKDVMSYLKLLINHKDDTAFLRIINTPRRDIGARSLEGLGKVARKTGLSLFETCTSHELSDTLPDRAVQNFANFANWIVLQSDNAERGDAVAVVRGIIEDIQYEAWLEDQASSPAAADRALENIEELLEWINRLCNPESSDSLENETSDTKDFADVISHIALMDMLARNDNKDAEGASQVQLMTLHAAKGLEYPLVYIIGMEEGILPHHNSSDDEGIEEERRLAYVGMTRARHKLTFTWAKTRSRYGETFSNRPSQFLDAIPEEDLVRLGAPVTAAGKENNDRAGKATLDSLRALLGSADDA